MTERLGDRPRDPRGRARRRAGHLWRRQPVRRVLRAGADGAGAVPRRRHSAPPDAGGDRARHLDLHHVGDARHAGDPERDPDAVLRHDAVRRARVSASSPPPSCSPSACGGCSRAEAARAAAAKAIGDASLRRRADAAADDETRARARDHGPRVRPGRDRIAASRATTPPSIVLAALPLVVVVAVNVLMSLVVLPRLDVSFLAEERLGRDVAVGRRRRLVGGRRAGGGDRRRRRRQLPAPAGAARDAWMPAPMPRSCRC